MAKHNAKPGVPSFGETVKPLKAELFSPGPHPRHAIKGEVVDKPTSSPPARKRTPAKRTPAASPTRTAPTEAGRHVTAQRRADRDRRIREGANSAAYQAALSSRGPSSSVVGGAGKGAAAGAAAGAALGSVVPGVGTAVGAGVGAGVGAVGGGAGAARRKKAQRVAGQPWRKALVGEFAACIVIVALSPMTDQRRDDPPQRVMKQFAAVIGLFLVLGLLSSAGRGAAKVATGLGGLVALVLAISERDLFVKLATVFTSHDNEAKAGSDIG